MDIKNTTQTGGDKMKDLTNNEMKALMIFVKSCLNGMGGKRPSDLEHDEYTWIGLRDLTNAGYNRHEASGTMGALEEKGLIYDSCEPQDDGTALYILGTETWKWLDTQWDNYNS
jgi:hypothetical protein